MRILYFSQYFPPEVGATQTRAYEMARGLLAAGHQVTMIAEVPNHPHGIIPSEYKGKLYERSELDGIDVIRVWVKASPVKNFRNRMAFYLSYMFMAAWAGLWLARGKYDAIYATSPPLFVGGAALMVSYLRRIPLFFEVRDLWPESAVVLGELRNRHAVRLAEWLEERCYHRARQVVVVTSGIENRLQERGLPGSKIKLIPNGANTVLFQPAPEEASQLRVELGLVDKFVILYAGIHGIAQGLELVLEAAEAFYEDSRFHFLFVGEGPVKRALQTDAQLRRLRNVTFHEQVTREQVPAYLSVADVALVPLRKIDLFKGALPSKMFDAWACECPTLITVPGEAQAILEQAEAGIWVEPENSHAFVSALRDLAADPQGLMQMGKNGRSFVQTYYSRSAQAKQLALLLERSVG